MTLVLVLLITAIMMVLVGAMLMTVQTQREVAANGEDFLKNLDHTEAGLAWAQHRLGEVGDLSILLADDDSSDSIDRGNLLRLRDMSLNSTSRFTSANENRASAIVNRDFFGDGAHTYEVIRLDGDSSPNALGGGPESRALVYLRVDDNPDETPDDPGANDPEADADGVVWVTAVTEYPIFVDHSGGELNLAGRRPPARRAVVAAFATEGAIRMPAIATNGDLEFPGTMKLCGDCGSAHTNQDLSVGGSLQVCNDLTATSRYSGSTSGVAGLADGGQPRIDLPTINPYDTLYMPTPATFDTSADSGLPSGLRCPPASSSDPGANKFFALVADDDQGRIFKAYWNFSGGGWSWVEIDNLADGSDVWLDDCGRVEGVDPNFGTRVNDAGRGQFYGFTGDTLSLVSCSTCSSSGADESLCGIAENDFGTQTVLGSTPLPGTMTIDGAPDFQAESSFSGSRWAYSSDAVYSPLYGGVIWVYGNLSISGNPGQPSSIDFRCSSSAGCSNTNLPYGLWKASFISVGDIEVSGNVGAGPANPTAGYAFQYIAGRDLKFNGNLGQSAASCDFGCSTGLSARIDHIASISAAHEQLMISGNPNFHGPLLAEDAIDCSGTVDGGAGGLSTVSGNPRIQYDCGYPPNPWDSDPGVKMLSWREIE